MRCLPQSTLKHSQTRSRCTQSCRQSGDRRALDVLLTRHETRRVKARRGHARSSGQSGRRPSMLVSAQRRRPMRGVLLICGEAGKEVARPICAGSRALAGADRWLLSASCQAKKVTMAPDRSRSRWRLHRRGCASPRQPVSARLPTSTSGFARFPEGRGAHGRFPSRTIERQGADVHRSGPHQDAA
jgi:hypothetical protein